MVTARDVHAGEETCYWSSLFPLEKRAELAARYLFVCDCRLCQYQQYQHQKLRTVSLFYQKLESEPYVVATRVESMIKSLQKVFGIQLSIDAIQFPIFTRKGEFGGALVDPCSEETLLSYITATADMYGMLIDAYADPPLCLIHPCGGQFPINFP